MTYIYQKWSQKDLKLPKFHTNFKVRLILEEVKEFFRWFKDQKGFKGTQITHNVSPSLYLTENALLIPTPTYYSRDPKIWK